MDTKAFRSTMKPESLMMSYGYKPELSEGAVKSPIFQTSTFAFRTAEEGKAFFELAYGKREAAPGEEVGLIYSRINNPDLEIVEDRLTLWDAAEACAVFESGMAAIATTCLEFLKPGDLLLYSEPVYGGTSHLFSEVLPKYGVETLNFFAGESRETIEARLASHPGRGKLAMVFIETPANPTNALVDIAMIVDLAKKHSTSDRKVLTAIDNTFLGPVYQHPLKLGMDLVLYSATKYIGGHSDLIAGACLGSMELIRRVKTLRAFLGTMCGPWTSWLLLRSLETLKMRMKLQSINAHTVAHWLVKQPKVARVHYLGLLKESDPQHAVFKRQCLSAGAMISFEIKGGEPEAFRFLNALKLIKLAVSLGSTESLAEHPHSMTHAGVDDALKASIGITESMIRLSVGVEAAEDIMWDIEQALAAVS